MFGLNFGGRTPDRVDRNASDGQTFYGYDQKDGSLDSSTKTPRDEDHVIILNKQRMGFI